MEDIYNDPAADERADEMKLRRAIESFRNEVRPSDLQAPRRSEILMGEVHWAWRKK